MERKNATTELIKQLCGEIRDDDGVDPRHAKRREQKPDYEKRDQRLGAQIRRQLELALPDLLLRSGVRFCEILSVEPAPDASRFSVAVVVNKEDVAVAIEVLARRKGVIRTEVAGAIHRKKAPDFTFELLAVREVLDAEG